MAALYSLIPHVINTLRHPRPDDAFGSFSADRDEKRIEHEFMFSQGENEHEFMFSACSDDVSLFERTTPMTSMTSSTAKTRTDAVVNRGRILSSARKVFARKGMAADMREIADEAGVAVGTLYRHFESREGLVSAFLSGCRAEILPRLLSLVDSDDPPAAFREMLRIGAKCREHFGVISEDVLRGQLNKHVAVQPLSDLLNRGIAQGCFRKDLDIPVVVAVAESIFFCGLSFLDFAGHRTFVEAADAIADFLLIGMVNRPQEQTGVTTAAS